MMCIMYMRHATHTNSFIQHVYIAAQGMAMHNLLVSCTNQQNEQTNEQSEQIQRKKTRVNVERTARSSGKWICTKWKWKTCRVVSDTRNSTITSQFEFVNWILHFDKIVIIWVQSHFRWRAHIPFVFSFFWIKKNVIKECFTTVNFVGDDKGLVELNRRNWMNSYRVAY